MYSLPSTAPSRPEINTTPLIDVLLVLLIIFMVAAPLRTQHLSVPVPQKGQQQVDPPPTRKVDLRFDSGSTLLFLDGLPIDRTALAQQLHPSATGTATAVTLRSEADVPYADVVRTVAALRNLGIGQLRVEDLAQP